MIAQGYEWKYKPDAREIHVDLRKIGHNEYSTDDHLFLSLYLLLVSVLFPVLVFALSSALVSLLTNSPWPRPTKLLCSHVIRDMAPALYFDVCR